MNSDNIIEQLIEYREVIWKEVMNDAMYTNQFINGLLYMYVYDTISGDHPGETFDLEEAEHRYLMFKKWASSKIKNFIQSVDDVYNEYIEMLEEEEEEDEEFIYEQAFNYTLEHMMQHWEDSESIKWVLKEVNMNLNKNIDELRDHAKEFDDWKEWDSDFDLYLETFPIRLIEEKMFE